MLERILSLPKTICVNLKCLPFCQAIKLPIAIHYKSKCRIVRGGIKIVSENIRPFMIRIGFHKVPVVPEQITFFNVRGSLIFYGTAHVGRGSRIVVAKGAKLELGDNFAISASSYINCYEHIKVGKDIQLAWGDLLMDGDAHVIYGDDDRILNECKEIILGDKIWIGCDCKILKGATIPDNCVVGANSVVTAGSKMQSNSLIVGSPAKSVKKIKGFKI